ncbi:MAG: hypothetical protein HYZ39_02710 [Mycolicibacterium cosmeticum]|nr:hypothetical protein [Mycolicibacterium cosmeticum]
MKKLLEFYLANFDFLYSDPGYRIADSRTGSVANAGMTVTGPVLEWTLAIDRGQFSAMVGPSHKSEGAEAFWISLLRKYVENHANIEFLPAVKEVRWARENLDRVVRLFDDPYSARKACDDLRALRRAYGLKEWGLGC